MKTFDKAGRFLDGAVRVLFALLGACILIATLLLDKNVDVPYPNRAALANWVYYLFAAILLGGLYLAAYRKKPSGGRAGWWTPRRYGIALAALAAAVAVIQLLISLKLSFVPSAYINADSDFGNIARGAEKVAYGGSLKSIEYFQKSPNNLNLAIVTGWLLKLFHRPRLVVWLGALLTNASVVLASLSTYNVTRRESTAMAVAAVGELLVALAWRAFLVYTDNYGMIFVALMVWLYTTRLRPEIKVPLITLCAACGCFIKVTCAIAYAALAVSGAIRWLRSGERRLNGKRAALYVLCAAVLFGGMHFVQAPLRSHYGYVKGEYPKGWQFLLMVGQNTDNCGAAGGNIGKVRTAFIRQYGDLKQVNDACLRQAYTFFRERGLWGNIAFYMKKMVLVYNDGYFHKVRVLELKPKKSGWVFELYHAKGKAFQIGASLFQTLWDMVLLTMLAYVGRGAYMRLRRRRLPSAAPDETSTGSCIRFLQIALLGITLYLMLLEGRAKYLYLFMPVFLTAFGTMFHDMAAGKEQ